MDNNTKPQHNSPLFLRRLLRRLNTIFSYFSPEFPPELGFREISGGLMPYVMIESRFYPSFVKKEKKKREKIVELRREKVKEKKCVEMAWMWLYIKWFLFWSGRKLLWLIELKKKWIFILCCVKCLTWIKRGLFFLVKVTYHIWWRNGLYPLFVWGKDKTIKESGKRRV